MTFLKLLHQLIDETTRFVSPQVVAIEWVMVACTALLIAVAPFGTWRVLNGLRLGFHRVADRKRLAVGICAILPIAVRISLLGVLPVPLPSIHDEFSHLLLGDTLAHGRFTNPTHPMWKHFETIHVIQQPTYNSMYPPTQGLFLGFGEAVFHEPWAGVLLSVGLMFAAMCWMMQGWLPPAWAFFGTLIAILKFGIGGLWMNSYLSGATSGIGGALVIGAVPRLKSAKPRRLDAVLFAVGMVILMNSRPFEGSILSVAALLYLASPLFRLWQSNRIVLLQTLLIPAAAVLVCGVIFTGYYSWRVTGSPLRMPYVVNRETYGWPENLAFLPPKQLTLRHKVLQDMYLNEVHHRDIYKSPDVLIDNLVIRLFDNWSFFIGPLLTIPLLLIPRLFRDRRTKPLVWFLALTVAVNLFQMLLYPYHLAPILAVLFALVAQGIRHIYVNLSRLSRRKAFHVVLVAPLALILIGTLKQEAETLNIPLPYWDHAAEPHREVRAYTEAWLSARLRKQLVIVRYAPNHPGNQEWVYNHADIDGSKVVWAREMDSASNQELLRYFHDREAWLLEADVPPARVVPYPQSEAHQ